jgi:hypothetical protein
MHGQKNIKFEQSRFWAADIYPASQIPFILWSLKDHYCP